MALVAGLSAGGAPGQPRPAREYGIDVQNINGSGCRKKDTAVALSNDNLAVTVLYAGFTAEVTQKVKDARKDCKLMLKIRAPRGNRYVVTNVVQRGYADLADGAAGSLAAVYGYPGATPLYRAERTFKPGSAPWQDTTPATQQWSDCDAHKPFRVDTDIAVTGKSDSTIGSSLTIDSTDADAASTTFGLRWEKC
ncbi:hypothetical protein GCM10010123_45680 [Pilimelia anulata]|uniref:DUF4360 domain-containing protein n=1 Tax=Pilimelia anulata TaxID=53371 RepID=A0A8J3BCA6_9ACTN|nr:hypothetical protein GCM10010123_45680 [Pilimelia anulata]